MLIIKNCALIDMAGNWGDAKDIVVQKGKVHAILDAADPGKYPGAEVIDAGGNWVTPGLVEAHSQLGVKEQVYRFEGDDANETGDPIMPHLRALDAINPCDEGFAMALRAGVTTVVTGPGNANLIGGTCAALKTWGKMADNRIIDPEIAFQFCLTQSVKEAYGGKGNMPKTRMGSAALIREALMKAKEYRRVVLAAQADETGATQPPSFDMKAHSLMRVFEGMPVKFTAHLSYDILTAVRLAEEFGLSYTLDQCSEAYLITDELKRHGARCVVGPAYGGKREYEEKKRDVIIGGVLERHGIDFAVSTGHPEVNIELSLAQLIMMHKKGLSRKAALQAVTLRAAEVVGLEKRVGSLEPGKDADIVIWDGEPLDYYTSASCVLVEGQVAYTHSQSA